MSLDFDDCYKAKKVGRETKKYIVFKIKCMNLLNIFHES